MKIRFREQRKTNIWRVVTRTGFGLLGWRAGFLTAKSKIVIDAEQDDSSDQLTLMDVCRREFVCSNQGELRGRGMPRSSQRARSSAEAW